MGKKTLEEMVSEIEERTNIESEGLIKDKKNLSFFSCLSGAAKAYKKSYRGKEDIKGFVLGVTQALYYLLLYAKFWEKMIRGL